MSPAWSALLFATVDDGVARAARDGFLEFLKTRVPANLGAPLASLARMQETVGEIDAWLQTNRALFGLANAVDAGTPPSPHQMYLAKYIITSNAIAAVEKAVSMIGNPALTRSKPLERPLRDVLCGRVHSPQAESAPGGAGRVALGIGPA